MSRDRAIAHAERYFDEGGFFADLARRVAIPTESQNPDRGAELARYLTAEMQPSFERLGFKCRVIDNPVAGASAKGRPFLLAERIEDPARVTVLSYGHGDVIRGQEQSWRPGLDPWKLTRDGGRLYGRGTADNKGQHSINLAAMAAAIAARGKLGFNLKVLIETGEEVGSPGLREDDPGVGEQAAPIARMVAAFAQVHHEVHVERAARAEKDGRAVGCQARTVGSDQHVGLQ